MEGELDRTRLTISESALDGLFQRILAASSVRTEYVYTSKVPSFSRSEVRLMLRQCRLCARGGDGGALRLDVATRAVFRSGLGVADHRIDLRCAVLVTPEITRSEGGGLVWRIDLGAAKVRDLQVEQRSRGGMFGFDPTSLDPFADDRLRETAKLALRAALRRFGTVDGRLSHAWVERVLLALPGPTEMALAVREGEVELAAEPESGVALEPSARPLIAARVHATDDWTAHLLEAFVASRGSARWRLDGTTAHTTRVGLEIEGILRPSAALWPDGWGLRFRARITPRLGKDEIRLQLDDFIGIAPRLPRALTRWVRGALETRLRMYSWPRSFTLAVPLAADGDSWQIEIAGVELRDGVLEIDFDAER